MGGWGLWPYLSILVGGQQCVVFFSPSNLTLSCQYCHHRPSSLGGSRSWAYCTQTGSSGPTKGFQVASPPFMLVAMFTLILPKTDQCHPLLVLFINSLETINDRIFTFLPQLLQCVFLHQSGGGDHQDRFQRSHFNRIFITILFH